MMRFLETEVLFKADASYVRGKLLMQIYPAR